MTRPKSATHLQALETGDQVAIAVEAPLAIPVLNTARWQDLGRSRAGEGSRPWSAGAGTGALATGLVQLAWLCQYIAAGAPGTRTTTLLSAYRAGQAQLLLGLLHG
jgi:hypothetical protein